METDDLEKIECSFIPIKKSTFSNSQETKLGIYSNSIYTFPDYGTKKWIVYAYLKVDHKSFLDKGYSTKKLINGCLNFLNEIPESSRRSKKIQKCTYGKLEPLVSKIDGDYAVKYKDDRVIIELITDDRQNPNFWGEGLKY